MKKVLFSSVFISACASLNAQNRLILAERFSNASCPPCAAQNPGFKALLDANSTKIVGLKYQLSFPGTDPMYSQNPVEADAKQDYYAIGGVPDTRQDGADVTVTQASINAQYAIPSPFTIALTHVFSADFDSVYVTANLSAFAAYSGTNTKFRLAMIERQIDFASQPGTNGEVSFHNVMRKMYPNATGTSIANTWALGAAQTITFGIPIPTYIYKISEIGFIGFIQEEGTKVVHQAGISLPVAVSNLADITLLNNVTPFFCVNSLSGVTATLKNDGTNPITSANVFYSVDGGAALSTPFTGTIAPAGTTNFALPTLTGLSNGSHSLAVWMQNINGVLGNGQIGNITKTFSSLINGGSGIAVSQDFAVTSFPYAGYTVTSSSPGQAWARAAANGGSLFFNNYSFPNGRSSELILPAIDMTALAGASLSFDVAHAQYLDPNDAAFISNDKLQVFVSQDCGTTWVNVYDKVGTVLSTAPKLSAAFTPTTAQWRREFATISQVATSNKAFVKFVATSNYGNNVWLDNIRVMNFANINDVAVDQVSVYPNPATDNLYLEFAGQGGQYAITLTDLTGRVVSTTNVNDASGAQKATVATSNLENGNYLLTITNGTTTSTKQVSVSK